MNEQVEQNTVADVIEKNESTENVSHETSVDAAMDTIAPVERPESVAPQTISPPQDEVIVINGKGGRFHCAIIEIGKKLLSVSMAPLASKLLLQVLPRPLVC
mgnify:CR=1 FL=1